MKGMQRRRTSSSVNELAERAKQGDKSAIELLWGKTEGLACWVMRRYTRTASVDEGDLLQAAYFAMLKAVRAYDPERGSFSTLYVEWLRATYSLTLGLNRRRVEEVACLDMPVNDDGDTSMVDLIEDQNAIQPEEQTMREDTCSDVRKAVDRLPERWGLVVQLLYFDGLSYQQCAERIGVEKRTVQDIEFKALMRMRGDHALQMALWGMTEAEMYGW